jgi:NADPH:quinone reductase-like Zn-dependent oxidoreductase
MKAIVQNSFGSADSLALRDIDRPVPRADEVLVRVRAAGVDPSVWHLMAGRPYVARLSPQVGLRRPANPVAGWDVAGTVASLGARVTGFRAGDEVFGSGAGTFAEYARVKAAGLAPKPAGLTFEQAAVLPVSGVTALRALAAGRARPGAKVLVIGASGGVGTYAVQLAAHRGARVTGVCGPAGAALVGSLGATDVLDYTREDLTGRYDLIVDAAGNRPLRALRRLLAPRGTAVLVGGENAGPLLGGLDRNLRGLLLSAVVRERFHPLVAVVRRPDLLTLTELTEQGAVVPVVDRAYPLAEAPAAVRHLRDGHPLGKLVVTV